MLLSAHKGPVGAHPAWAPYILLTFCGVFHLKREHGSWAFGFRSFSSFFAHTRHQPTKTQLSSNLSQKKIVKNAPEWMGTAARRKERHIHHNTQHKRQFDRETSRLSTYTQRSVADALRLKFFFFVCPLRGAVSLTS